MYAHNVNVQKYSYIYACYILMRLLYYKNNNNLNTATQFARYPTKTKTNHTMKFLIHVLTYVDFYLNSVTCASGLTVWFFCEQICFFLYSLKKSHYLTEKCAIFAVINKFIVSTYIFCSFALVCNIYSWKK